MESSFLIIIFLVSFYLKKNQEKLELIKRKHRKARQRRLRLYLRTRNALIQRELSRRKRTERTIWSRPRSRIWWEQIVPTFSDAEFLENFRVKKETFAFLTNELQENLVKRDTKFRKALSVDLKIGCALWKLATNCDYRTIGHLFGVARSTACTILHDVVHSINQILSPTFIRCPMTEEFRDIMNGFHSKWGFPNTIGAIDGTHLPIIAPKEIPADYYNRKGFYSIILQAVVDSSYKFWNINVGWAGRVHDARVFANSTIYALFQQGHIIRDDLAQTFDRTLVNPFLIGDAAYPLMPWLLKPFRDNGNLTEEKKFFNYMLSKARMVVENAFGRLKGRWRCLMKRNDLDTSFIPDIAECCCTLHNICETFLNEFPEEWLDQRDLIQVGVQVNCHTITQSGEKVRGSIINYLLNQREQ